MSEPHFIWISRWEDFQHYKDRRPPWIKFYTRLLDDDTYLELTEHRALLLHRLWLAFASTSSRLRLDTASLSRHTFLRVTKADIESLSDAGFIEVIDSPELARRVQVAMPRARTRSRAEVETEVEVEKEQPVPLPPPEEHYEDPADPEPPHTPNRNGAGTGAGTLETLKGEVEKQLAANRADDDVPF